MMNSIIEKIFRKIGKKKSTKFHHSAENPHSVVTSKCLRLLSDDDVNHILSSTDNFWQNLVQSLENIASAARRLRENIEDSAPFTNHSLISGSILEEKPISRGYFDDRDEDAQYFPKKSPSDSNTSQYGDFNNEFQDIGIYPQFELYHEDKLEDLYQLSCNKPSVLQFPEQNKRTGHPIMGKVALLTNKGRTRKSLSPLRLRNSPTKKDTRDQYPDPPAYCSNQIVTQDHDIPVFFDKNEDNMPDIIHSLVHSRFQSKLEDLKRRSLQRKKKRCLLNPQPSTTEDEDNIPNGNPRKSDSTYQSSTQEDSDGAQSYKGNIPNTEIKARDSLYSSTSEATNYSKPWEECDYSESGTYEECSRRSSVTTKEENGGFSEKSSDLHESFTLLDNALYVPQEDYPDIQTGHEIYESLQHLHYVDNSNEGSNQYDESQASNEANVGSPGHPDALYMNWPTLETERMQQPSSRSTVRSQTHSCGSSDLSTLVSGSRSQYDTLEENNRIYPTLQQRREDLLSQLKVQDERLKQTLKAMDYCKSKHVRRSSMRNLEVDKILLLESYKREAITMELSECNSDIPDTSNCGTITFRDLRLSCREKSIQYDSVESIVDTTEYFVCIMSYKTDVQISEVETMSADKTVSFEKAFKFARLPVDFEISLCVYSTKTTFNEERRLLCPSGFSRFLRSRSSKRYNVASKEAVIPSAYKLCGKRTIRRRNLGQNELALFDTPISCSLQGNVSFNMESSVKFFNTLFDFINIGSFVKGVISWNRYWCLLEDSKIKYWTHPPEVEEIPPIGVIDLEKTVSSQISEVSRNLCPRPRTLFLKMTESEECSCYFLSMGSIEMLKKWKNELNLVIRTLRDWNCLKS